MPLQYEGILKEHLWCRQKCAVFDTSHMAKFRIQGEFASDELSYILTVDAGRMKEGRCRYCFILNDKGGIVDDVVVYTLGHNEYILVANAGTKEKDFKWIKSRIKKSVVIDADDYLDKIDVQGPLSDGVLYASFGIDVSGLSFYSFGIYRILDTDCIISRSGYTGGKGYELYVEKSKTEQIWNALLRDERVKPAGLGARDTLRIEAGLPLYGQDIDEEITPVEAGMERFVDFSHEFIGRKDLKERTPEKKMVFLLSLTRQAPRHGHKVFVNGEGVGYVTSGSFSPCLQKGIGIAYIHTDTRIQNNEIVRVGTTEEAGVDCSITTKRQLQLLTSKKYKMSSE